MRRVLSTQSEKLDRADSRTERARQRLLQPDAAPDPPPPGLGLATDRHTWMRSRKQQRASVLFDSIRQKEKQ